MADDCAQPDGADGPHLQLGLHYSLSLQHTHTHTHSHTQRERATHAWTNGMPLATIFVKILQYFVLYAERDASRSELQAELPSELATSAWSSFFVDQRMFQYV